MIPDPSHILSTYRHGLRPLRQTASIIGKAVTLLCALAALALPAAASPRHPISGQYNCTSVTLSDGLPHDFIEDMMRDHLGFVWISTGGGGLARYDGYGCVNFNTASPTYPLRGNFVKKVTEDRHGRLWIASDGGIDIIDASGLRCAIPADHTGRLARLLAIPSGYVETDRKGCVWIQNNRCVSCIRFADDGSVATVSSMGITDAPGFMELPLKAIGDEGVWFTSGGVVYSLTDNAGRMSATPVDACLRFDPNIHVSDYVCKDGEVWISSNHGLHRFNPNEHLVKTYIHDPSATGSLSQNFVTSLAVTPDSRLMIGSLRGVDVYNPIKDSFEHYDTGSSSVAADFVNCLMTEGDAVWIGTEGSGIRRLAPRQLLSYTVRHDPGRPSSLSANPVNALFQDSQGNVWIGTVEGGLNKASDSLTDFSHFTAERGQLSHNSVSALAADSRGRLWVGTWGGGIDVLDMSDPSRRLLHIDSCPGSTALIDYIGCITYDPINSAMWIGANIGLFYYDLRTSLLSEAFPGSGSSVKGSVGAVIDRSGHLWLGGSEGLYDIDLHRRGDGTFSHRYMRYRLDNPASRTVERITAVTQSDDGDIWIATNGNGIYRRSIGKGKETFVNYTSHDGLSSNIVYGIVNDTDGNVWAATHHGLSCLTEGSDRFVTFGTRHGLSSDQFYWNATARLADGRMLLGTVCGLEVLSGMADRESYPRTDVVYTSVRVTQGDTPGDETVPIRPVPGVPVRISEHDRAIEIEFSALDYNASPDGRYMYRLKGFDDEWAMLPPGRHHLTYTNLPGGTFTLETRYVPHPGDDPSAATVSKLDITVVPPFYKKWWFVGLVILVAGGLTWWLWRRRIDNLKRQRNLLQKTVEERVREIDEQRRELQARAEELTRHNAALMESNEQISRQKAQLTEMNRKVQQLTMDRISFFTNITHEFRTPITLIIGPIERALRLSTNPRVIEQLRFVEHNSKFLLSLVNQLMDFRKVEAGKMEIVVSPGNLVSFIEEVVLPFRPHAEERGIRLETIFHIPRPLVSFDSDALRKVLINLLGNAIKFTPDHGRVTLHAAIFPTCGERGGHTLYISVSDTGNGISADDIDKVFGRFYQGKSQIKYPIIGSSDSGIGLYLCHNIIQLYGGSISVRNNRGAGCTFRILLPIGAGEAEPEPASAVAVTGHTADSNADNGGERLTILVVEDNSDMRAYIRSILEDSYDVVEANDGAQAMQVLLARQIDFIVSDLMMPVMDGLQLAAKVRENFSISHIPILMLTAKTSDQSRLESYRCGVDSYLLKPFDDEMLLARIRNIIGNRRRQQRCFGASTIVDDLNIDIDSRDKKFMEKVMEVIKANYTNCYFEVGDFAESLGVSRSLLNRKLQSLAGQPPTKLVRAYRLNVARELIIKNRASRSMNISEIAYSVGFNDSKYFTRCFTKQYGVTPSAMMKSETEPS